MISKPGLGEGFLNEPDPTLPDPVAYFKVCLKADRGRFTQPPLTRWMKVLDREVVL